MLTAQMFHSKDGLAQLARLSDSAFVYLLGHSKVYYRKLSMARPNIIHEWIAPLIF